MKKHDETDIDGLICAAIEESPLGFFRTFMPQQLTEVASKQQFWIGKGKFVVYLECYSHKPIVQSHYMGCKSATELRSG